MAHVRMAAVAAAIVVIGCGSASTPRPSAVAPTPPAASSTTDASRSASAPSSVGPPAGVIAIGHSGLTGEGTGTEGGTGPSAKSWVTGESPLVNSVWSRLKAVRPDLAGEAVNEAEGGALADRLPAQVRSALTRAPSPALIVISTIDGDIRCDGTDPQHVPELGASVKETLDIITTQAPAAKVLVIGQFSRPSVAFVKELIAHDPSVVPSLTGPGMCDFLDESGKPIPEHFAALTSIIDAYEAEQARVCAMYPNCVTDGGVRKAYVDKIENYAADYAHLNVKGQAAQAELIWPVVEKLLGL